MNYLHPSNGLNRLFSPISIFREMEKVCLSIPNGLNRLFSR